MESRHQQVPYKYVRHPRPGQLQSSSPVKSSDVLHDSFWGRVNAKIGLRVTVVVGTMWAAYLFLGISLLSAPSAFRSHDPIVIVSWISQSFLQLILLPVIIVGQNIQSKAADRRAEETYHNAVATFHETKEIQAHLSSQDKSLSDIIDQLDVIAETVRGGKPPHNN